MSRYAVWLIPLAIPILLRAETVVSSRARRWFVPLALASCLWSVVAFQPRRQETYCKPTRIASIVWARWPSLDNPLPEVFAERVSTEEPGLAPVATPGCTKALLIGGQWPVPCWPQPAPSECARPDALCYANRGKDGYEFTQVAAPHRYTFKREGIWIWTAPSASGIERVLQRVRWRDLRLVPGSATDAVVRGSDGVSWTYELQNGQDLLVYVGHPTEGAALHLRLPETMTGVLLDADTGDEIQSLRIEGRPAELTRLIIPPGPAVVLALRGGH
jgi:hypothetical protein